MSTLIDRSEYLDRITRYFRSHSVVALLGPRQCGKTTLANQYYSALINKGETVTKFDLEDPQDLQQLENPKLTLDILRGTIIIDEIQNRPDLFPILRVLVDKLEKLQRYIILGSASRDLIQQSSETLAGRISYIELTPLSLLETHQLYQHWLLGGYPKSFLASTVEDSLLWRHHYISTFLERDIPSLGFTLETNSLRRFWNMLAHYHGNIVNLSELSRSLGISQPTIKRYLDILVGTFMIRELKPWHENIAKRQVKQSKVYFRDSGLLHSMLGISTLENLQRHPKLGASWEGYALEEFIRKQNLDAQDCYFWATHQGAKIDLLIHKHGKKYGYEFKYADAPTMTKSIHSCLESLSLEQVHIIYPGNKSYPLHEKVKVTSINQLETIDGLTH